MARAVDTTGAEVPAHAITRETLGIGAGETALRNVDGPTVAAAHNAMRAYVGDPAHGLVLSAGGLVGTFLRVNPSAVAPSNDDAALFI